VRACRLALALVLAGLLPALAAPAWAKLPAGFAGVVPQAPLSAADYDRIGAEGLGLRLVVRWAQIETRPGHYDFAALDAELGAAADRGIRVLPEVDASPAWLKPRPFMPPLGGRGLRSWRAFLRAMVERYGPGGEFWRGRERRLPIHRWQIWNEPNFAIFWEPKPSVRGYAKLLDASASAIRAVDPKAQIVAAAVAPIAHEPPPWVFLRRLYAVPGARADFDLAALHPYAPSLRYLAYQLDRTRRVMAAAGDRRKPILITEFGVASDALHPNAMDRGPRGQARFLEAAFERLARERRWRVAGAFWFAWRDGSTDDPYCVFCRDAGLFTASGEPKPAWRALRRVLGGGRN
jgi:Glycosyl hydrolase catalytic core